MIDDTVVVDAVVHPYNLSPENQNPDASEQLERSVRWVSSACWFRAT